MSLFDEHKAERRARIGRAARQLVASRGYEGLTMRELARVAKVAVPTLYNLFGSKDAILVAELEASARQVASQLQLGGPSFFARGMAAFEMGMKLVEDSPEFYRACMQMFLTSPETAEMRRNIEAGYIAIMAGNLTDAKAAGQLADWAEPDLAARHMFAIYISALIGWGVGELDLATFRAAALSGVCHVLAGVARGPFAADVEAKLRSLPPMQFLRSAAITTQAQPRRIK
ncbi:MAG TPA: TetR/AcrR family transcriptional regulator [Kofleriaceae bacterium]|jgi:AcrR family transcriptional regulator|nr:TetR/AcrR family transcriptional regulator [Kofleriaceae bacterium]